MCPPRGVTLTVSPLKSGNLIHFILASERNAIGVYLSFGEIFHLTDLVLYFLFIF